MISLYDLLNCKTVGNSERYYNVLSDTIKQLSRGRFKIKNDKILVNVLEDSEILEVVVDNSVSVYDFQQNSVYAQPPEPSIKFMINKLSDTSFPLVEALRNYKEKYYIKGEDLKEKNCFKLYSLETIEHPLRGLYKAKWIDYKKQLEKGNIIFDEDGINGIFAFPETMLVDILNEESINHYGDRLFYLKPINDCYYLNDGEEIIGDRFEVVKDINLKKMDELGVLFRFAIGREKEKNKKLLSDQRKEYNERIEQLSGDLRIKNEYEESIRKRERILLLCIFLFGIIIGALIL